MQQILQLFILIPFVGFFISVFIPRKKESSISAAAIFTVGIHLFVFLGFVIYWLMNGHPTLDIKHFTIFKTGDIEIFIDFYFDKITAMFALVGSVLTFLVTIFSRYYLHREEGFKRFFNTMLLFFTGYNMVVFSGNFETLFIGWEAIGVSSFLLIAFYRDRYLPVKNAMKTLSIYRFGDICLILAMWMSHHLWHENITFLELNDLVLVKAHLNEHYYFGVFVSLMILIAAAAKSAQLPFSSWLPRAMEGPTTSSAVFYGSLSVHLGAFLLLRTYPYWETIDIVKIPVIFIGLTTSLVATGIARVQSTVKTQIAYSSVAQIGLIFIEAALGFHNLALIHFAGNAFLRTYQLLVSPSVLGYLVHEQFFNFMPHNSSKQNTAYQKIKNSFYILSVKEWNLDTLLTRFLWTPFKTAGNKLNFLTSGPAITVLSVIFILGLIADYFIDEIPSDLLDPLPFIYSFIGVMLVIRSFAERGDAIKGWTLVITSQLFITISIALLNEHFGYNDIFVYLSGSVISAVVGYICLKKIKNIDGDVDLNKFHGYVYEKPFLAFIFLLSCLGLVGLPFTPTFIGIDILFSHIHKKEVLLIIFTALNFVFIELSLIRMYSRIFLGQHKKTHHPIAYRSS